MSYYIVWTDTDHAKLFALRPSGVTVELIQEHAPPGPKVRHQMARQATEQHLFKEVVARLQGAEAILLLGPGVGKVHLRQYITRASPKDLEPKVVGVDTTDHPTDPEIVALGRQRFQLRHDFFASTPPKIQCITADLPADDTAEMHAPAGNPVLRSPRRANGTAGARG